MEEFSKYLARLGIEMYEVMLERKKTRTCSQLAPVERIKGATIKRPPVTSYRPKSARKH